MTVATSSPPKIDLQAPILPQVGDLGDTYWSWVHRSIKPKGTLRIFRSGFWEATSHIAWWHPLVFWVPVILALWGFAGMREGLPWGGVAALAVLGLAVWTFVEYVLHRWIFHYRPSSAFGRRLHFLAHGIHHLDPWDPTRLVFPPLAGVLVATPIYLAIYAVCAWLAPASTLGTSTAIMGGLLSGYLVYDMTHYYTHHGKPKGRWGKFLKAYHLAHHHKWPERMYGVSSPLWDLVFRTTRPRS